MKGYMIISFKPEAAGINSERVRVAVARSDFAPYLFADSKFGKFLEWRNDCVRNRTVAINVSGTLTAHVELSFDPFTLQLSAEVPFKDIEVEFVTLTCFVAVNPHFKYLDEYLLLCGRYIRGDKIADAAFVVRDPTLENPNRMRITVFASTLEKVRDGLLDILCGQWKPSNIWLL